MLFPVPEGPIKTTSLPWGISAEILFRGVTVPLVLQYRLVTPSIRINAPIFYIPSFKIEEQARAGAAAINHSDPPQDKLVCVSTGFLWTAGCVQVLSNTFHARSQSS